MKVAVEHWTSTGGKLRHETFTVHDDHPDPEEQVNLKASAIIETWVLAIGDTIHITEQ